ncbi:hypothetical protein [Paenibacillus jilunlii]|uniref:hypothetical protein n=1 Tax=Paenibacillus jilunlii TaxID=682956 RepID=UPI000AA04A7F|nr:hypothetical protein [Paenibacillus jilunlii]
MTTRKVWTFCRSLSADFLFYTAVGGENPQTADAFDASFPADVFQMDANAP